MTALLPLPTSTVRVVGTFKAGTMAVTAGVPSMTYALTDPTTVTLLWTAPDGTETTYTYAGATVTKQGTGVFYKDISLTTEGPHRFKWTGTGAVAAAERIEILAREV